MNKKHYAVFTLLVVCLWSAANFYVVNSQTNNLSEGFEAGGKSAYAVGTIALGSGSWTLDDALTGNLSSDAKTGAYSARVRNTGKVTMNFNVANVVTVSVQHALYGADSSSTRELWQSTSDGSSWTKVGSTVTSNLTTLSTVSFTVNSSAAIRFEVRKVSGGTNRINIDNIVITAYSAPTPTPTPTPTPQSEHLTMGNPSGAVTDVNQPLNS